MRVSPTGLEMLNGSLKVWTVHPRGQLRRNSSCFKRINTIKLLPINMPESNSSPPCITSKKPPFRTRLKVNASGSRSLTTEYQACHRSRRSPQNAFGREIERRKQLHLEKRAAQYEKWEEQSTSVQEYMKALDIKECVLEVQAVFLRRLAKEENRLKEFTDGPSISLADFGELVKEVERSIQTLQY